MNADKKTSPEPIEQYVRHVEMARRREHRLLRAMLMELEGVGEIQERLLNALRDPQRVRRDEEELRENILMLGFIGDGAAFDELVRIANPNLEEDPQHIDLAKQPAFKDEYTRAEFFTALGMIGHRLSGRNVDQIRELMRLLRRGIADEYPEVRAAAAEAVGLSVKYHKQAMEHVQTAVEPLIKLLVDPSWFVRRATIRALAELPDPRSVRALKVHAEWERDAALRRLTEWAFKRVRDRASYFRYVSKPVQALRDMLPGTKS